MAKFHVNKGYGTEEYTIDAADYTVSDLWVTFTDANGYSVFSLSSRVVGTIEREGAREA